MPVNAVVQACPRLTSLDLLLSLTQVGSPTAQAMAATAQVQRRKWKMLMSRFRRRITCYTFYRDLTPARVLVSGLNAVISLRMHRFCAKRYRWVNHYDRKAAQSNAYMCSHGRKW